MLFHLNALGLHDIYIYFIEKLAHE